jgi:hypothetical protein
MQEKQILNRISKAEQRIVDLYRKLTGSGGGGGNSGYDIYQVLLSASEKFQTQTVVEIQNTLGVPVTWGFSSESQIKATIPGGWNSTITGVNVGPLNDQSRAVGAVKGYEVNKESGLSNLIITALDAAGQATDEAFKTTLITIIVKK